MKFVNNLIITCHYWLAISNKRKNASSISLNNILVSETGTGHYDYFLVIEKCYIV